MGYDRFVLNHTKKDVVEVGGTAWNTHDVARVLKYILQHWDATDELKNKDVMHGNDEKLEYKEERFGDKK